MSASLVPGPALRIRRGCRPGCPVPAAVVGGRPASQLRVGRRSSPPARPQSASPPSVGSAACSPRPTPTTAVATRMVIGSIRTWSRSSLARAKRGQRQTNVSSIRSVELSATGGGSRNGERVPDPVTERSRRRCGPLPCRSSRQGSSSRTHDCAAGPAGIMQRLTLSIHASR